ncbi:D-alanyl-D-alanine carboxypeptidase family protein [Aureimonas phyllosphaerae]|uniref:serine-type D-Ala-D-Ala carboxypeptidase n=1 Tax=Aureimonas phyllosphaerae TaxID=1166078 RepID=A0A7W6FU53_9HYPH|nr:D-alanyl-D-alanine carboxypeptidase family protein [Aureimonas phyllosphaerae]MBB3935864.1 D-alanyl-D-alanine carboxypeptidase (penicillin-binding protein 5/6) [Aureimonas phyllosphaerae]MBB3959872.1 D-alanyl-D-alanine carboxypeptidase (penicillin-binding protein 5/6) [Aureimonas phyllosphaerae]SFF16016.1 D-alanyl-D-alanine carboxypeptidase (penicillin-binding protein 5/6) [Aureimonas phyllosphaerae]
MTTMALNSRRIRGPLAAFLLALSLSTSAHAFETAARSAVLLDFDTNTVLFEKNPDDEIPPASLSKLMTLLIIFDELKRGAIRLDETFPVSENAWRTGGAASGGSTMFLPLNSEVSVGDLIKGIAIQSGNDATIVAAEGIAGSVPAFAELMNKKAQELGLTHSHFVNPHGLPDPGQRVSARDLVTLATHIIRTYPDQYPLFSEEEFTFNGITQRSRNPLLSLGADGLKTGHTAEAGYGLVASAKDDAGRRIVFAMTGMKSVNERATEARAMMTLGLRGFENVVILKGDETAGEVPVTGGIAKSVPVKAAGEIRFIEPRGTGSPYQTEIVPVGPIEAPVPEGRRVAQMRITRDGQVVREEPLYAATNVERAGLLQRVQEQVMSYFQ